MATTESGHPPLVLGGQEGAKMKDKITPHVERAQSYMFKEVPSTSAWSVRSTSAWHNLTETSDYQFIVYRKFGWIQLQALLELQDELSDLEKELERYDRPLFPFGESSFVTKSRTSSRSTPTEPRERLMLEIKKSLSEYGE